MSVPPGVVLGVADAPIPTLDTKGGVWLAEPIILSQHNSGAARGAKDPLPTITTGDAAAAERQGCARPMLVQPFVDGRGRVFVSGSEWPADIDGDAPPVGSSVVVESLDGPRLKVRT